ncbi:MAG: DinB family protein [Bacteroidetes bacterium]|nr:MAG: DinB family protein [Bacteroidota bacterium]
MLPTIQNTLQELVELLLQLDELAYTRPVNALSHATIGQHTRHIIELFQCLLQGYEAGKVHYDKRKRDKNLENHTTYAIEALAEIQQSIYQKDKPITLYSTFGEAEQAITSFYFRELLYNLEHCIHHQALIKVALFDMPHIHISDTFGVAPSTIQYRLQYA